MSQTKPTWDTKLYKDKHSFVYQFGEALIVLLNPQPNERILDLGCGAGQLTAKIQEKATEVVGLDKSQEMIEAAKAAYPEIQFLLGDAANFEFEEKFDAVFSNAALHWVTNYQGAVQSMYNCLKPGGRMVVEFGGKGNVQSILYELRQQLREMGYAEQADLPLWYFPSVEEHTRVLEAVGFKVKKAMLYDRSTPLSDESTGIKDWLEMFGKAFFVGVSNLHKEKVLHAVQKNLKNDLFKDGQWYADYKRIRIEAAKHSFIEL